jgi:hypothetical protein
MLLEQPRQTETTPATPKTPAAPTPAQPAERTHSSKFLPNGIVHGKKNVKLMDINYRRNFESDYTERMMHLQKAFKYEDHSHANWTEEEFSLLYGSPLWEQSSPAQRLALNHLFWVCFYNYSIGGEVSTMTYNQLTASALYPLGGYETVCRELDLETGQERDHVDAFRKVGRLTETALFGETIFDRPIPHYMEASISHPQAAGVKLRPFTKFRMLFFAGVMAYSPFVATQYYILRGLRNIQLKVKEYQHSQYCTKLEKSGEFVPSPAAISHYHYLDEAFHTATSTLLCHDMYKDFGQPSRFETFASNFGVKKVQMTMNTLSGCVPGIFADDRPYMALVFRMLQKPLFGMNAKEALEMTEKCFCREHDGFHVAAKYHKRAFNDNRNYVDGIEYLTPANRELRIMSEASLAKSMKNNRASFDRFARAQRVGRHGTVAASIL